MSDRRFLRPFAAIGLALLLASCSNTWTEDDKSSFRKTCLVDAQTWAGPPSKAASYCDCVLGRVMARYPNVNDALEHLDSLINDPYIRACKAAVKGQ